MTEPEVRPKLLTVRELSKLWNVTEQCVHKWNKASAIQLSKRDGDGRWVLSQDEARRAKVLREADAKRWLSARKVPESELDLAVHVGKVTPEVRASNGEERFSIDDLETVAKTYRESNEASAAPKPLAPPVVIEPSAVATESARDRRRVILDYLENARSPSELPTWFWDVPDSPAFVPPLDVFRFEFAARRMNEESNTFVTDIKRSAGYTRNGAGQVVFVPEDDAFALAQGLHPKGATPPWLEHENRMWELAREDWFEQVRLHGHGERDTRPGAHERRDREGAIRKYIATRARPCDLPDWFWDVEEMPPFVPPMQVFYYQCGETFVHEASGPMTWMIRSEGWGEYWTGADLAPEPHYMPFDMRAFAVEGTYPTGMVPDELAEENWRYLVARQEWEAEWRRRRSSIAHVTPTRDPVGS
jgi:hypothetical protein